MTSTVEIVSNITKIFRFYDLFDNQESIWCDVTINVKHLKYNTGQEFYDITYSYLYNHDNNVDNINNVNNDYNINDLNSEDDNDIYRTNPFYYKRKIITFDMLDGVIVAKNSMTDEMVKYLLMDFDELDKHIGNTWTVLYKANIMFALAFMWD